MLWNLFLLSWHLTPRGILYCLFLSCVWVTLFLFFTCHYILFKIEHFYVVVYCINSRFSFLIHQDLLLFLLLFICLFAQWICWTDSVTFISPQVSSLRCSVYFPYLNFKLSCLVFTSWSAWIMIKYWPFRGRTP